jgi:hypothetical protein
MWEGSQRHTAAALPPGKTRYLFIGDWVLPGFVWTGAENLANTGIRTTDRPARSEPLYRLSYSGQFEHLRIYMLSFVTFCFK